MGRDLCQMVPRYGQGAVPRCLGPLVLALAVLAAVTGQEGTGPSIKEQEELQDIQDVADDATAAEKSTRSMWNNFKGIVNSYLKENKRLAEQNFIISRDVDDGRIGIKVTQPTTYAKIPNFKFLTAATPLEKELTLDGCEVQCSMDFLCASYSWSSDKQVCFTSTKTLSYDPDVVTYLKKEKGEGDPTDNYQAVPGLLGDIPPVSSMSGGTKMSFNECKHRCTTGPYCLSFIYNEKAEQCIPSGDGAEFDPQWTFFEKNFTPNEHKELNHRGDEHAFKEKLKKEWAVQNKLEITREKTQKKELQSKCRLNDIEELQFREKNAAKVEVEEKKTVADTMTKLTKHRSDAQLHSEGFVRSKTAAMKLQIHKELKQKEGMKVTSPKRVEEIYTKQDEIRQEYDSTVSEREKYKNMMVQDKMERIDLDQKRRDVERSSLIKTEDKGMLSARIMISVAEHQERCGAAATADLAAKLMEEKEVTAQAKQMAIAADNKAISLQQASEKANKAMVAENTGGGSDDAEENAHKVAKQAQQAADEAKETAQEQLADTTKKDELKMEVKRGVMQQQTLKEKVYQAREYLKSVEKRRQAAVVAEAENDANEQTP